MEMDKSITLGYYTDPWLRPELLQNASHGRHSTSSPRSHKWTIGLKPTTTTITSKWNSIVRDNNRVSVEKK